MMPRDALRRAVRECKKFYAYDYAALRSGIRTPWKTPAELDADKKGLCRDFAIWTIARTWTLCGGLVLPDEILMVIGHVDARSEAENAWHAWVELVDRDEHQVVIYRGWGEPTPGYSVDEAPAEEFTLRVPRYAQLFDGEVFDQEFEYRRVA